MAHKNKSNISPFKTRHKDGPPSLKKMGKHRIPDRIYSIEEANDRLYDIFKNHGFQDYPHDKRRKLAEFYVLLMENQKKENFTRLLDIKDIGIKHFIDCLMVTKLTDLQFPLLDVGTGPGFPGVPLKIHFAEEKIILAEGVQRRVEFLKLVRESMQLRKLDIIGRNINQDFAYPVQGVITRAVEDVRNTLGNCINSIQTGGRVYFMKGPGVGPELELAQQTWGEYYRLVQDIAYELPRTTQARRLVIFEKTKAHALDDDFFERQGLTEEDLKSEDY